jgi:hypothetical protein
MPKRRRKTRLEKIADEESGKNIPITNFTTDKEMKIKLVEKKE